MSAPKPSEAVYGALVAVYERRGRATVREVAEEAGRSTAYTFVMLRGLAEAGRVVGLGTPGALRPAKHRPPVWVRVDDLAHLSPR